MAPFFKKRLCCFYCGRRSTQPQKGPIRQWECKECDAVNHLDENGEITDPPTAETASETRFAQPLLPHGVSDPQVDTTLFCPTCVKNQHLLTESLASYLPLPSHADYATYEASYPSYRRSLEERYPQVCVSCEPRARDRIRQAGYAAKSDHLRRMMERSRGGKLKTQRWNWRGLLVSMGAMGYWGSILGQIGWNFVGAMALKDSTWEDSQRISLSTIKSCIVQGLRQRQLEGYCPTALTPYAGFALILGVLSLWWNPRLRDRVARRGGRLVGLDEYYRIQIFVLVARFVAWACLQDPSMSGLNPRVLPAIHIFMGVFTIISVIISRRTVQFNTTPVVSWQETHEPLIPHKPDTSHDGGEQLQSPPDSQVTPVPQRFPINNLAAAPTPRGVPYNPPTPPPEIIDDSDAMDWTPSQFSLQPNHSIARVVRQPAAPQPSPFHGQLPTTPNPPAWQLRNAQNRQVPPPPAETPRPNPFNQDSVCNLNSNQEPQQPESTAFAPPKFFPPGDYATDTGLESLFNDAFRIADGPTDVQKARWQQMMDSKALSGSRATLTNPATRILKCALLSFSLLAWFVAEKRSAESKQIEIISLAVACLVAGFSLLETLKKPATARSVCDIIISLVELVASAFLGGSIPRGSSGGIFFAKTGEYLLSFMAAQEILGLVWPRYISTGLPKEEPETATVDPSSRPATRDTTGSTGTINAPCDEGISTIYTATPRQNVQHTPTPSPSFSVASSSHTSSIASPFSSRNAAADIKTPIRSQMFAPATAPRPNYSPMPSFIGFSLDDNDAQQPAAAAPTGPASRRYPLRARRS